MISEDAVFDCLDTGSRVSSAVEDHAPDFACDIFVIVLAETRTVLVSVERYYYGGSIVYPVLQVLYPFNF